MKWIPFSEQQPTPGPYLVTDGKIIALIFKYKDDSWSDVCCGRIIGYNKTYNENYEEYLYEEELTHWMPLPSIPESTK